MSNSNRHSRRDFLRGKSAAHLLRDAVDHSPPGDVGEAEVGETTEDPARLQGTCLMSISRRVMACDFEVQLAAKRQDDATEQALLALDLVEALEDQMTVYRDDSELAFINQQAAHRPVDVEPRLFGLLQQAQQLYHDTEGALDITSGPLSQVWGFSQREGRLPSEAEIAKVLERVGFDHVVLDETNCTVKFDRSGVKLNLNSIGKGFALDREAELLAENDIDDFLLHGGRSSVLARGNHPGLARPGWCIGLRHPLRPEQRLAEFILCDQALSTSGSATQFFRHHGRRYGHILDPRTGRPAEGIYSATVIAPTAAEADALSTAFYVMGPEKVGEYCLSRPELRAVLVCPADREGEIRLFNFGLTENGWRRSPEAASHSTALDF